MESLAFVFVFNTYLFICEKRVRAHAHACACGVRGWTEEKGRESQANSALRAEPDSGLSFTALGS